MPTDWEPEDWAESAALSGLPEPVYRAHFGNAAFAASFGSPELAQAMGHLQHNGELIATLGAHGGYLRSMNRGMNEASDHLRALAAKAGKTMPMAPPPPRLSREAMESGVQRLRSQISPGLRSQLGSVADHQHFTQMLRSMVAYEAEMQHRMLWQREQIESLSKHLDAPDTQKRVGSDVMSNDELDDTYSGLMKDWMDADQQGRMDDKARITRRLEAIARARWEK